MHILAAAASSGMTSILLNNICTVNAHAFCIPTTTLNKSEVCFIILCNFLLRQLRKLWEEYAGPSVHSALIIGNQNGEALYII